MYYAYIIQSNTDRSRYYHGHTRDLRRRIIDHNKGQDKHTSKFKPWRVVWYGAFKTKELAEQFEKYLKSASGKAFYRKRFIS